MKIFDLMQPKDEESLEILLRPETVPFQSSETWLNFLSHSFSYNAAPCPERPCHIREDGKNITLNLIHTGELGGNRMIPQSGLYYHRYNNVELMEWRRKNLQIETLVLNSVLDIVSGYDNT